MMKRYLILAALLAAVACEKNPASESTTPEAPTAITLSASSFTPVQAGETLSLTITSPARPKLTGLPW